jgi:hypothetical protein
VEALVSLSLKELDRLSVIERVERRELLSGQCWVEDQSKNQAGQALAGSLSSLRQTRLVAGASRAITDSATTFG